MILFIISINIVCIIVMKYHQLTVNLIHKDFLKLKKSKTGIKKQIKKKSVLKNASWLYNRLTIICKKEYGHVSENKDQG